MTLLLPTDGTSKSARQAIAAFSGAIVTDRLVMRSATADDLAELYPLFNNWEVVRWLATPAWPHNLNDMRGFLAKVAKAKSRGDLIYFTILHGGSPIGGMSWNIEPQGSHIGYWIGQPYWARGLMSEAAGAMCDAIFAVTDERQIFSGVFEGNIASLRVQKKLGFLETGRSQVHCVPRNAVITHIDTKLTRTARRVALAKGKP